MAVLTGIRHRIHQGERRISGEVTAIDDFSRITNLQVVTSVEQEYEERTPLRGDTSLTYSTIFRDTRPIINEGDVMWLWTEGVGKPMFYIPNLASEHNLEVNEDGALIGSVLLEGNDKPYALIQGTNGVITATGQTNVPCRVVARNDELRAVVYSETQDPVIVFRVGTTNQRGVVIQNRHPYYVCEAEAGNNGSWQVRVTVAGDIAVGYE